MDNIYVRNYRETPYWTDRIIVSVCGRFLPQWVRPNHITIVRFCATPLVWYALWQKQYILGLVAFLIVAFTDALDGALARTRSQITPWGIMYDPVADKFLIVGTVLILVVHRLGLTLALIIVGLEAITLIGGLYFKYVRKMILPANGWGKAKMCFQVVASTLLVVDAMIGLGVLAHVAFWVFVTSSILAVLSLLSHGS